MILQLFRTYHSSCPAREGEEGSGETCIIQKTWIHLGDNGQEEEHGLSLVSGGEGDPRPSSDEEACGGQLFQ